MSNQLNLGTLRTDRDEEEDVEMISTPVDRDTIGRPVWWFKGSLFFPKTLKDRRMAVIQYQTLTRNESVLSERASRIRQYISFLSEWFPITLLDCVGSEILLETNLYQREDNLFIHFLGVLETYLRKNYNTIRWQTLKDISEATGQLIDKKDIYRWMFYTRQRKKEASPDTVRIIQRLALEEIQNESLNSVKKRKIYENLIQTCHLLRAKGFICKDPEIVAWSLKRILLDEKGRLNDIPEDLRESTTRMTFRVRKILKSK